MAEYIDREALIQELDAKLCALHGELDENRIVYDAFTDGFEECVGEVGKFQSAADVVPLVHGRWILEREPNGKPYCFHCSVCDSDYHYIGIVIAYDYCPNCGAKMDGGATNAVD